MPNDREQEKRRLEAHYSAMTEGELREIADEAASLSDDAVQALQQEIARRDLEISLNLSPGTILKIEREGAFTYSIYEIPIVMQADKPNRTLHAS